MSLDASTCIRLFVEEVLRSHTLPFAVPADPWFRPSHRAELEARISDMRVRQNMHEHELLEFRVKTVKTPLATLEDTKDDGQAVAFCYMVNYEDYGSMSDHGGSKADQQRNPLSHGRTDRRTTGRKNKAVVIEKRLVPGGRTIGKNTIGIIDVRRKSLRATTL